MKQASLQHLWPLQLLSRHQFITTMAGLKLPPPVRLGEAVPANLRLGA